MRYPDGDDRPARFEPRNFRKMAREEIYRNLLKISNEIRALLFQDDPLGRNFGPNDPEYDREAQAILPQLRKHSTHPIPSGTCPVRVPGSDP